MGEHRHSDFGSLLISMEYFMLKSTQFAVFPIAAILLAGCAAPRQTTQNTMPNTTPNTAQSTAVANRPGATAPEASVSAKGPGYAAFQRGDYAAAIRIFKEADVKKPNSPYDELDIGAAYQNMGRMAEAMPYYREAMTGGHNVYPTSTTKPWAKGLSVEEIACHNIALGLKAATIEGTAVPCQTTVALKVIAAPGAVAPFYRETSYNTYFDFDQANLTVDGQTVLREAAKEIRENPDRRVTLVGKASSVGTTAYNYELSKQRVETVRNAMINAGIPASRIDITWVGESDLPVSQDEGTRESLNRVVEGTIK
jgi:outer membrane protein OmpA-like peptidoglycan-associated protein